MAVPNYRSPIIVQLSQLSSPIIPQLSQLSNYLFPNYPSIDKIFMIYRLNKDHYYDKTTILSGSDHLVSSAVSGIEINLEDIFGNKLERESDPD